MRFIFEKFTSPKLSTSQAIYVSNSDRATTRTSQQIFNSASNFDPDVLFLPFACHKIK